LTVVSSLAEGADRLVAREVLEDESALLEAPLPFPRDRYVKELASDPSRRELDELLSRASVVHAMPVVATVEDAYERAGHYVVDRSDVLLALWDGEPARGKGGTADIVEYARARGTPLVWICAKGDFALHDTITDHLAADLFEPIDEFNRALILKPDFDRRLVEERRAARGGSPAPDGAELPGLDDLCGWVHPHFVRADILSLRFQALFLRLTEGLFAAPTLAVWVIAAQLQFNLTSDIAWIEVALLALALAIVGAGRRLRLQRRWLAYRFLAERFRSAFFLALAGLGDRQEGIERLDTAGSSEEWLRRAFGEVWNARPRFSTPADFERLRSFLATGWLSDQVQYFRKAADQHQRRHRGFVIIIAVLFLLTIVAAILHSLRLGHGEHSGDLVSMLSLTLPALGAALSGLAAQREHHRHAERYQWLTDTLAAAQRRMQMAPDVRSLQKIAAEAELVLLDENRDWFGVMRFHDFELHL
jgi:hypothetical protein